MARSSTSGQGRPKGATNKVTREIRELAAGLGPAVIQCLARIAADPMAPTASRVAACRELLDRGYGRPSTAITSAIKAGTLAEQGAQVIKAATAGKLPLDHAESLMAMLSAQAKLAETTELAERLEELESMIKKEVSNQ